MPSDEAPTLRIEDFRDYLIVLARSRIGSQDAAKLDASDIVQETLLEAHRKSDQFRGSEPASMAAWLRQMLACNLTDRIRSLHRQKRDASREVAIEAISLEASSQRLNDWIASQQSTPSLQLRRLETLLELASAMEQLPEAQREAVRMRYIDGLALADIAQRLNRTTTAVAGLLKRGLEHLRGQLDRT
jgi:RNA polymerase sigma-70 factor (ECF subfamily)